jgi:diadenosine tetraphosphate (Ap4A) HIT family hydrolase
MTDGDVMDFLLDRRLAQDSIFITNLPLSQVRLMDCRDFPWLILVPQRANCVEWIDLPREDQHQLSDEIAIISHILKATVTAEKINISALGNIVSQLHIHVTGRYARDAAWPKPVFGFDGALYASGEAKKLIYELKTAIDSLQLT